MSSRTFINRRRSIGFMLGITVAFLGSMAFFGTIIARVDVPADAKLPRKLYREANRRAVNYVLDKSGEPQACTVCHVGGVA